MKPTWLIEADVPGVNSEALQAEIRRQGMTAHSVKPWTGAAAPRDLLGAEHVPPDACVVFLGTLHVMEHIQRHRRWRPGGWCNFDRLACSVYYAYLGPYLLNQNYTLLPGVEAIRHADRLVKTYGSEGKVFARPDSVRKVMRGGLVSKHALEQALSPAAYDPTTLVLIAEPQEVIREWRLVIANSQVIAASQYYERGKPLRSPGCPDEVTAFAERILGEVTWRPDPLFVLDVCESASGLRLVELNSFSCSGLYACDLAPVVSAAAECASNSW